MINILFWCRSAFFINRLPQWPRYLNERTSKNDTETIISWSRSIRRLSCSNTLPMGLLKPLLLQPFSIEWCSCYVGYTCKSSWVQLPSVAFCRIQNMKFVQNKKTAKFSGFSLVEFRLICPRFMFLFGAAF